MPTYTLIGATGSTGSSILRCLLCEPPQDLQLNILVRSKSKLLQAFPRLEETAALRIRILEGTSTDTATLCACLADAAVIFMCVGQNGSSRGTTLYSDTVAAIIDTLGSRQQRGNLSQIPTIIQLRSASLNPDLACQVPSLVHRIVSFCLHHSYADMKRACDLYQPAAASGLLHYVLVDPPTIHDAGGTECTGYRLISTEKQEVALSYADLGAAMCEIAQRAAEFRNQPVGVTAAGPVKATWTVLAGYLASGASERIRDWMVEWVPVLSSPMAPFFYVGTEIPTK